MANIHTYAGKLATARRWHPDNPEAIATAERDLAEAKIEDAIRRALAVAPPLTAEQRARLGSLLSGGAA